MDDILEKIEAIRKDKGIKQADMAERMNVTQSAYSNYVNRNNDIPYGRLTQIANIFGMSVVDVITYPKKYVDIEQIAIEKKSAETEGKVAVLFEVSQDKKQYLLDLVLGENRIKWKGGAG